MLPQVGNGLGDGGVVKSFGSNPLFQWHGLFGVGNCMAVNGCRGVNCFAGRLRRIEFGGGQFNGKLQHQQKSGRWPLDAPRSQSFGAGREEEQQQRPAERSVHFIGIGGAGLSALAFLALEQGWQVSGSDATSNDLMNALTAAGATVYAGHAPSQVINPRGLGLPDAVVVSSAVPRTNEEVEAAQNAGVPIYKRADWLGKITEGYDLLAVAGSHGKSTTAAMLAIILKRLGDDVTAVVGAEVPQFPGGRNAIYGQGRRFVLEADEYDGCFLGITPALAVITSVEWEHVDIFPDEASVRDIFKKFVLRIRPGGTLIVCGDGYVFRLGSNVMDRIQKGVVHCGSLDILPRITVSQTKNAILSGPYALTAWDEFCRAGSKLQATSFDREEDGSIADRKMVPWLGERDFHRVVTYGLDKGNDWQAMMLTPNVQGGTDYVAVHAGTPMARVSLQIPGAYNVLNSLAALVAVSLVGSQEEGDLGLEAMKRAAEGASKVLAQFVGVRRRFEFLGEVKGCVIIDDYAHHPTEVRAVLQAARQRFDGHSIWVVFQPHTYSRLVSLLNDFALALSAADRVIVTEVYSAREKNIWNISGADLVALISGPPALFIASLDNVVERLSWELRVNENLKANPQKRVVLLTLGAGDITKVGSQLLKAFQATPR